jgi:hypothetical protein
MKSNNKEALHPQVIADQPNTEGVCLASCRKLLRQIKGIKARILAEFRQSLQEHEHVLELALNEAEALAWQSGFPALLFPVLAAEKADTVAAWHARQAALRQNGLPLAAAA